MYVCVYIYIYIYIYNRSSSGTGTSRTCTSACSTAGATRMLIRIDMIVLHLICDEDTSSK